MTASIQNRRERQRVIELIREYTAKGYSVLEPSTPGDLPDFLRDRSYIPDLIVRSKGENLVVEVKSSENLAALKQLSDLSELINAQKDWQFVLVLTNPRQEKFPSNSMTSRAKVLQLLKRARHVESLDDPTLVEAWFIYAWVAAEACLDLVSTSAQADRERKGRPMGALTYVRDLAMEGELDRKDAQRLVRLYKTRSAFLHSTSEAGVMADDVKWLQAFTESLLSGAAKDQRQSEDPGQSPTR
jgi:uncharacterized protein YutE (UPF0331/DUF86 family)